MFLSRALFLKTATDTTQSLEGLCIVMPGDEDVSRELRIAGAVTRIRSNVGLRDRSSIRKS